ncbi:MAG: DNA polymerase I [Chloroflexota bacterium]|nr:DNA polymerase I [Chloroflexota bacterium]MDE2839280.1 DNA polymerase I [Chloroflexota bacterium]MDE2931120.1 DNA polymerase I [Chloroflexota bacterium]
MSPTTSKTSADSLVLIDGHSIVHRAFFAVPKEFTSASGEPTNAVFGFTNTLLYVIDKLKPKYVAVAFDLPGPTFRHEQFAEYKATRPEGDPLLFQQMGRVQEVVETFNIPIFAVEGYEADDVLGTLSRQAAEQQIPTFIVTGDTDAYQLVDDTVRLLVPRPRSGELAEVGPEEVAARFEGLTPAQVIDYKALVGDTSDNVPGVRGIGKKTAGTLLQKYGDIKGILDNVHELPTRQQKALAENKEQLAQSRGLVTIVRDMDITLDQAESELGGYDQDEVLALFRELSFRSLLDRLPQPAGAASEQAALFGEAKTDTQAQVLTEASAIEELCATLRAVGDVAVLPVLDPDPPAWPRLRGIALAWGGNEAAYVDLAESEALEAIAPALSDRHIPKIVFDAKALCLALLTHGVGMSGVVFDCHLAGYFANVIGARSSTLKQAVFDVLGATLEGVDDLRDRKKSLAAADPAALAQAAAHEAEMLLSLRAALEEYLDERNVRTLHDELELPLATVIAQMEFAGIAVDVDLLQELTADMAERIAAIEDEIYKAVGHEFKINSPKQLGDILVHELDIPLTKKTKTGFSTDSSVLEPLRGAHEVVDLVLNYRQLTKLKSTYLDALPTKVNPQTQRIHTSFEQTGSATGRLSSNDPNLQNIPIRTAEGRKIRKAFVAGTADQVLLAADYSQIDLRVLAHLSQDEELCKAFRNEEDIHTFTASQLFDVGMDDVTAAMRRTAKTVNFGIVYGVTAHGLEQRTDLDFMAAAEFIENYFDTYKGVRLYMDKTKQFAHEHGYVETVLGRRRYIRELQASNFNVRQAAERMAINMPVQGTSADIIKVAMLHVADQLAATGLPVRMLLQVHDELVFECDEAVIDATTDLVIPLMENAVSLDVPVKVDAKVGASWDDMEPLG